MANYKSTIEFTIGQEHLTMELVEIGRNAQKSLVYRELNTAGVPTERLRTAKVYLAKPSKSGVIRTSLEVTTPLVETNPVTGKVSVIGQCKSVTTHFYSGSSTAAVRGKHLKLAFAANSHLRDSGSPTSFDVADKDYSDVLAGNANIVL